MAATRARVTWCAVGSEEKRKCDEWNGASNGRVTCTSFPTTEDCITAIMVGSLGHVWCGHGCLLTVRLVTQDSTVKEESPERVGLGTR